MAQADLQAIRDKVRRLTRSPSVTQLTNDQIDESVNTFVLYDIPEELRLFNYRTVFTFYTNPYIDQYTTNTTAANDQFYEFKNRYITIHPPAYVAGFQISYSQDRNQFFAWYPVVNSIFQIGTGNGVTQIFTGTVNGNVQPVLQNQVTFTSIGTNNQGLTMHDVPIVDANGNPTDEGNLYVPGSEPATPPTVVDPTNTINYVTGVFTVTFPAPPGVDEVVNSQTVPYSAARPNSMLYYDGVITLRPVPDQPYRVDIEAYIRPTELIENNQQPDLQEMWQYIACGASMKIFEDRSDLESMQQLQPIFKKYERYVLRRTLVQYSNDRVATIYTSQLQGVNNPWGWNQFT